MVGSMKQAQELYWPKPEPAYIGKSAILSIALAHHLEFVLQMCWFPTT